MDEPSLEERLALVLRGVQRMADGLGGIETRLTDVAAKAEEHRLRSRTELSQLGDVVTALAQAVDVVLREQQGLAEAVRKTPPSQSPSMNAVERLTEAVRGLRDDLAESHQVLQRETAAAVERAAGEQADRALRLHEAIGEAGQKTVSAVVGSIGSTDEVAALAADLRHLRTTLDGRHVVLTEAFAGLRSEVATLVAHVQTLPTEAPSVEVPAHDDSAVRSAIAGLRDDLGRLQGELLATAGQLQIDAGAGSAELRDQVVAAVAQRLAELRPGADSADAVLDRLAALETRLPQPTSLEPVLDRLAELELRLAEPPPAADAILRRLVSLEERLATPADLGPVLDRLDGMEARLPAADAAGLAERFARLELRLAATPPPPLSLDPVLERLAGLEARLSAPADRPTAEPVDLTPVLDRLAGLEARLSAPPTEQPVAEPVDLEPVLDRLAAIERRLTAAAAADRPVPAETDLTGVYDRLGGIEWRLGERLDPLLDRITSLEQRIQPVDPKLSERLQSLEQNLEQVAQRDDLRRGVDRVLGAVSSSEQAVAGEVRAVDARIGAIAEEVRIVRVLRDGLDALADGIDGVRQLAARSATSQQMTEVTRELGAVLAEIETARSQVVRVERSTQPVHADVVQVGSDVDDLGKRIDQLAEVIEERMTTAPTPAQSDMAQRLRQMSESARLLGNGVLEDLRVRRSKRR